MLFRSKAFIGVSGITLESGLTEFNFEEAGTKRTMFERAQQRIVVADHTKFGRIMLTQVAPLSVADIIITGQELDEGFVKELAEAGIKLLRA